MSDYPRFRPSVWWCLKTLRAKHGIQGQFAKGEPYRYVAEDGETLLFGTKQERDIKLAELRGRVDDGSIEIGTGMGVLA